MEETNTNEQQQQQQTQLTDNTSVTESTSASISTPTPEELKREQQRKYYMELQKKTYERYIEVVMNQTTYTREEAIAGLQKHKGNVMLVVKEFLGVPEKSEPEKSGGSLNQKRYGVIRDFMDKAATSYIKAQERNKIVNEILEKQKKMREESLKSDTNTIVSSTESSTQ
jgi:NACalpha-BTF3-like transcription factor